MARTESVLNFKYVATPNQHNNVSHESDGASDRTRDTGVVLTPQLATCDAKVDFVSLHPA